MTCKESGRVLGLTRFVFEIDQERLGNLPAPTILMNESGGQTVRMLR